ncbi:putative Dynein axonemal heavy chain 6 [Blattamonas nauphoetae]|uniref:Dynein axonemal heavy chain 6 n=1 Tax=Blattamonas nauphoetae TaxID=2049346 RepID=A0ABQ9XTE3_9EUKA|nr:putative Dynein axonemal heavy chain 6 [Blattamonas nauphoetae]
MRNSRTESTDSRTQSRVQSNPGEKNALPVSHRLHSTVDPLTLKQSLILRPSTSVTLHPSTMRASIPSGRMNAPQISLGFQKVQLPQPTDPPASNSRQKKPSILRISKSTKVHGEVAQDIEDNQIRPQTPPTPLITNQSSFRNQSQSPRRSASPELPSNRLKDYARDFFVPSVSDTVSANKLVYSGGTQTQLGYRLSKKTEGDVSSSFIETRTDPRKVRAQRILRKQTTPVESDHLLTSSKRQIGFTLPKRNLSGSRPTSGTHRPPPLITDSRRSSIADGSDLSIREEDQYENTTDLTNTGMIQTFTSPFDQHSQSGLSNTLVTAVNQLTFQESRQLSKPPPTQFNLLAPTKPRALHQQAIAIPDHIKQILAAADLNAPTTFIAYHSLAGQAGKQPFDFVYLGNDRTAKEKNMYSLRIVPESQVDYTDYYTLSVEGLMHYNSVDNSSEIIPTQQWIHERKIYSIVSQKPFFRSFRLTKYFRLWKKALSQKVFDEGFLGLDSKHLCLSTPLLLALQRVKECCLTAEQITYFESIYITSLSNDYPVSQRSSTTETTDITLSSMSRLPAAFSPLSVAFLSPVDAYTALSIRAPPALLFAHLQAQIRAQRGKELDIFISDVTNIVTKACTAALKECSTSTNEEDVAKTSKRVRAFIRVVDKMVCETLILIARNTGFALARRLGLDLETEQNNQEVWRLRRRQLQHIMFWEEQDDLGSTFQRNQAGSHRLPQHIAKPSSFSSLNYFNACDVHDEYNLISGIQTQDFFGFRTELVRKPDQISRLYEKLHKMVNPPQADDQNDHEELPITDKPLVAIGENDFPPQYTRYAALVWKNTRPSEDRAIQHYVKTLRQTMDREQSSLEHSLGSGLRKGGGLSLDDQIRAIRALSKEALVRHRKETFGSQLNQFLYSTNTHLVQNDFKGLSKKQQQMRQSKQERSYQLFIKTQEENVVFGGLPPLLEHPFNKSIHLKPSPLCMNPDGRTSTIRQIMSLSEKGDDISFDIHTHHQTSFRFIPFNESELPPTLLDDVEIWMTPLRTNYTPPLFTLTVSITQNGIEIDPKLDFVDHLINQVFEDICILSNNLTRISYTPSVISILKTASSAGPAVKTGFTGIESQQNSNLSLTVKNSERLKSMDSLGIMDLLKDVQERCHHVTKESYAMIESFRRHVEQCHTLASRYLQLDLSQFTSIPLKSMIPSAEAFRNEISRIREDYRTIANLSRIINVGCFRLDARPFVANTIPYVNTTLTAIERLIPQIVVSLCEDLATSLETHIQNLTGLVSSLPLCCSALGAYNEAINATSIIMEEHSRIMTLDNVCVDFSLPLTHLTRPERELIIQTDETTLHLMVSKSEHGKRKHEQLSKQSGPDDDDDSSDDEDNMVRYGDAPSLLLNRKKNTKHHRREDARKNELITKENERNPSWKLFYTRQQKTRTFTPSISEPSDKNTTTKPGDLKNIDNNSGEAIYLSMLRKVDTQMSRFSTTLTRFSTQKSDLIQNWVGVLDTRLKSFQTKLGVMEDDLNSTTICDLEEGLSEPNDFVYDKSVPPITFESHDIYEIPPYPLSYEPSFAHKERPEIKLQPAQVSRPDKTASTDLLPKKQVKMCFQRFYTSPRFSSFAERGRNRLDDRKVVLESLNSELLLYTEYAHLLERHPPDHEKEFLEKVQFEWKTLWRMWTLVEKWDEFAGSVEWMTLGRLKLHRLRKKLDSIDLSLNQVEAAHVKATGPGTLRRFVNLVIKVLPCLSVLTRYTLKDRHRLDICRVLGISVTNETTIGELVNSGLINHLEELNSIARTADAEYAVEAELRRLETIWSRTQFGITTSSMIHHEDFNDAKTQLNRSKAKRKGTSSNPNEELAELKIIAPTDSIITTLDDSELHVNALLTSPYSVPVIDQLKRWKIQLGSFRLIVLRITEVQSLWISMYPFFSTIGHVLNTYAASANTDTDTSSKRSKQTVLSAFQSTTGKSEQKIIIDLQASRLQFREFDSKWMELLDAIVRAPTIRYYHPAPAIVSAWRERDSTLPSNLSDILQQWITMLETAKSHLVSFFDSRRVSFTRFYFLTDSEISTLVTYGGDIQIVLPLLSKIFGGIRSFGITTKVASLAQHTAEANREKAPTTVRPPQHSDLQSAVLKPFTNRTSNFTNTIIKPSRIGDTINGVINSDGEYLALQSKIVRIVPNPDALFEDILTTSKHALKTTVREAIINFPAFHSFPGIAPTSISVPISNAPFCTSPLSSFSQLLSMPECKAETSSSSSNKLPIVSLVPDEPVHYAVIALTSDDHLKTPRSPSSSSQVPHDFKDSSSLPPTPASTSSQYHHLQWSFLSSFPLQVVLIVTDIFFWKGIDRIMELTLGSSNTPGRVLQDNIDWTTAACIESTLKALKIYRKGVQERIIWLSSHLRLSPHYPEFISQTIAASIQLELSHRDCILSLEKECVVYLEQTYQNNDQPHSTSWGASPVVIKDHWKDSEQLSDSISEHRQTLQKLKKQMVFGGFDKETIKESSLLEEFQKHLTDDDYLSLSNNVSSFSRVSQLIPLPTLYHHPRYRWEAESDSLSVCFGQYRIPYGYEFRSGLPRFPTVVHPPSPRIFNPIAEHMMAYQTGGFSAGIIQNDTIEGVVLLEDFSQMLGWFTQTLDATATIDSSTLTSYLTGLVQSPTTICIINQFLSLSISSLSIISTFISSIISNTLAQRHAFSFDVEQVDEFHPLYQLTYLPLFFTTDSNMSYQSPKYRHNTGFDFFTSYSTSLPSSLRSTFRPIALSSLSSPNIISSELIKSGFTLWSFFSPRIHTVFESAKELQANNLLRCDADFSLNRIISGLNRGAMYQSLNLQNYFIGHLERRSRWEDTLKREILAIQTLNKQKKRKKMNSAQLDQLKIIKLKEFQSEIEVMKDYLQHSFQYEKDNLLIAFYHEMRTVLSGHDLQRFLSLCLNTLSIPIEGTADHLSVDLSQFSSITFHTGYPGENVVTQVSLTNFPTISQDLDDRMRVALRTLGLSWRGTSVNTQINCSSALLSSLQNKPFAIVVGGTASGKSSSIRLLAQTLSLPQTNPIQMSGSKFQPNSILEGLHSPMQLHPFVSQQFPLVVPRAQLGQKVAIYYINPMGIGENHLFGWNDDSTIDTSSDSAFAESFITKFLEDPPNQKGEEKSNLDSSQVATNSYHPGYLSSIIAYILEDRKQYLIQREQFKVELDEYTHKMKMHTKATIRYEKYLQQSQNDPVDELSVFQSRKSIVEVVSPPGDPPTPPVPPERPLSYWIVFDGCLSDEYIERVVRLFNTSKSPQSWLGLIEGEDERPFPLLPCDLTEMITEMKELDTILNDEKFKEPSSQKKLQASDSKTASLFDLNPHDTTAPRQTDGTPSFSMFLSPLDSTYPTFSGDSLAETVEAFYDEPIECSTWSDEERVINWLKLRLLGHFERVVPILLNYLNGEQSEIKEIPLFSFERFVGRTTKKTGKSRDKDQTSKELKPTHQKKSATNNVPNLPRRQWHIKSLPLPSLYGLPPPDKTGWTNDLILVENLCKILTTFFDNKGQSLGGGYVDMNVCLPSERERHRLPLKPETLFRNQGNAAPNEAMYRLPTNLYSIFSQQSQNTATINYLNMDFRKPSVMSRLVRFTDSVFILSTIWAFGGHLTGAGTRNTFSSLVLDSMRGRSTAQSDNITSLYSVSIVPKPLRLPPQEFTVTNSTQEQSIKREQTIPQKSLLSLSELKNPALLQENRLRSLIEPSHSKNQQQHSQSTSLSIYPALESFVDVTYMFVPLYDSENEDNVECDPLSVDNLVGISQTEFCRPTSVTRTLERVVAPILAGGFHILIDAPPVGKTVALKHLLHKWAKGEWGERKRQLVRGSQTTGKSKQNKLSIIEKIGYPSDYCSPSLFTLSNSSQSQLTSSDGYYPYFISSLSNVSMTIQSPFYQKLRSDGAIYDTMNVKITPQTTALGAPLSRALHGAMPIALDDMQYIDCISVEHPDSVSSTSKATTSFSFNTPSLSEWLRFITEKSLMFDFDTVQYKIIEGISIVALCTQPQLLPCEATEENASLTKPKKKTDPNQTSEQNGDAVTQIGSFGSGILRDTTQSTAPSFKNWVKRDGSWVPVFDRETWNSLLQEDEVEFLVNNGLSRRNNNIGLHTFPRRFLRHFIRFHFDPLSLEETESVIVPTLLQTVIESVQFSSVSSLDRLPKAIASLVDATVEAIQLMSVTQSSQLSYPPQLLYNLHSIVTVMKGVMLAFPLSSADTIGFPSNKAMIFELQNVQELPHQQDTVRQLGTPIQTPKTATRTPRTPKKTPNIPQSSQAPTDRSIESINQSTPEPDFKLDLLSESETIPKTQFFPTCFESPFIGLIKKPASDQKNQQQTPLLSIKPQNQRTTPSSLSLPSTLTETSIEEPRISIFESTQDSISSEILLLWCAEMFRVFGDLLTDINQRKHFVSILSNVVQVRFSSIQVVNELANLFSSDMDTFGTHPQIEEDIDDRALYEETFQEKALVEAQTVQLQPTPRNHVDKTKEDVFDGLLYGLVPLTFNPMNPTSDHVFQELPITGQLMKVSRQYNLHHVTKHIEHIISSLPSDSLHKEKQLNRILNPFVFADNFTLQSLKLSRALLLGHALVVGPPSSGKKSLSEASTKMLGWRWMEPHNSFSYQHDQFRFDLKLLMLAAGAGLRFAPENEKLRQGDSRPSSSHPQPTAKTGHLSETTKGVPKKVQKKTVSAQQKPPSTPSDPEPKEITVHDYLLPFTDGIKPVVALFNSFHLSSSSIESLKILESIASTGSYPGLFTFEEEQMIFQSVRPVMEESIVALYSQNWNNTKEQLASFEAQWKKKRRVKKIRLNMKRKKQKPKDETDLGFVFREDSENGQELDDVLNDLIDTEDEQILQDDGNGAQQDASVLQGDDEDNNDELKDEVNDLHEDEEKQYLTAITSIRLNKPDVLAFFAERVRKNLHFIISLSPHFPNDSKMGGQRVFQLSQLSEYISFAYYHLSDVIPRFLQRSSLVQIPHWEVSNLLDLTKTAITKSGGIVWLSSFEHASTMILFEEHDDNQITKPQKKTFGRYSCPNGLDGGNPTKDSDVEAMLRSIPALIVRLHLAANNFYSTHHSLQESSTSNTDFLSQRFQRRLFTPHSIVRVIRLYGFLTRNRSNYLRSKIKEWNNGVLQLQESHSHVHRLQLELKGTAPRQQQEADELAVLLKEIETEQAAASVEQENVKREEEKVLAQAAVQEELKQVADAELEHALPPLREAEDAINRMDPRDIDEMRSYNHPPEGVLLVMDAVCPVLGVDVGWASAKQLLGQRDFRQQLLQSKDSISEDTVQFLKKYIDDKGTKYTEEAISKISTAAASLCVWTKAVVKYREALKKVKPLQFTADEAMRKLDASKAELAKQQEALAQIENRLSTLQRRYTEDMQKSRKATEALLRTKQQLATATNTLKSLSEENERWVKSLNEAKLQLRILPASCLLTAVCIVYGSALDGTSRDQLFSQFITIVDSVKHKRMVFSHKEARKQVADELHEALEEMVKYSKEPGMVGGRAKRFLSAREQFNENKMSSEQNNNEDEVLEPFNFSIDNDFETDLSLCSLSYTIKELEEMLANTSDSRANSESFGNRKGHSMTFNLINELRGIRHAHLLPEWIGKGLMADRHSIESAFMAAFSPTPVIFVDPSGIASRWLRSCLPSQAYLLFAHSDKPRLSATLRACKNKGGTAIITSDTPNHIPSSFVETFEQFPQFDRADSITPMNPSDPLAFYSATNYSDVPPPLYSAHLSNLTPSDMFRMFLVFRGELSSLFLTNNFLSSASLSPNVTIVNFTPSRETMIQFFLFTLLKFIVPAFAQNILQVKLNISRISSELLQTENIILTLLATSPPTEILENPTFLSQVIDTQQNLKSLHLHMESLKQADSLFNQLIFPLKLVAEQLTYMYLVGSSHYFAKSSLFNVTRMDAISWVVEACSVLNRSVELIPLQKTITFFTSSPLTQIEQNENDQHLDASLLTSYKSSKTVPIRDGALSRYLSLVNLDSKAIDDLPLNQFAHQNRSVQGTQSKHSTGIGDEKQKALFRLDQARLYADIVDIIDHISSSSAMYQSIYQNNTSADSEQKGLSKTDLPHESEPSLSLTFSPLSSIIFAPRLLSEIVKQVYSVFITKAMKTDSFQEDLCLLGLCLELSDSLINQDIIHCFTESITSLMQSKPTSHIVPPQLLQVKTLTVHVETRYTSSIPKLGQHCFDDVLSKFDDNEYMLDDWDTWEKDSSTESLFPVSTLRHIANEARSFPVPGTPLFQESTDQTNDLRNQPLQNSSQASFSSKSLDKWQQIVKLSELIPSLASLPASIWSYKDEWAEWILQTGHEHSSFFLENEDFLEFISLDSKTAAYLLSCPSDYNDFKEDVLTKYISGVLNQKHIVDNVANYNRLSDPYFSNDDLAIPPLLPTGYFVHAQHKFLVNKKRELKNLLLQESTSARLVAEMDNISHRLDILSEYGISSSNDHETLNALPKISSYSSRSLRFQACTSSICSTKIPPLLPASVRFLLRIFFSALYPSSSTYQMLNKAINAFQTVAIGEEIGSIIRGSTIFRDAGIKQYHNHLVGPQELHHSMSGLINRSSTQSLLSISTPSLMDTQSTKLIPDPPPFPLLSGSASLNLFSPSLFSTTISSLASSSPLFIIVPPNVDVLSTIQQSSVQAKTRLFIAPPFPPYPAPSIPVIVDQLETHLSMKWGIEKLINQLKVEPVWMVINDIELAPMLIPSFLTLMRKFMNTSQTKSTSSNIDSSSLDFDDTVFKLLDYESLLSTKQPVSLGAQSGQTSSLVRKNSRPKIAESSKKKALPKLNSSINYDPSGTNTYDDFVHNDFRVIILLRHSSGSSVQSVPWGYNLFSKPHPLTDFSLLWRYLRPVTQRTARLVVKTPKSFFEILIHSLQVVFTETELILLPREYPHFFLTHSFMSWLAGSSKNVNVLLDAKAQRERRIERMKKEKVGKIDLDDILAASLESQILMEFSRHDSEKQTDRDDSHQKPRKPQTRNETGIEWKTHQKNQDVKERVFPMFQEILRRSENFSMLPFPFSFIHHDVASTILTGYLEAMPKDRPVPFSGSPTHLSKSPSSIFQTKGSLVSAQLGGSNQAASSPSAPRRTSRKPHPIQINQNLANELVRSPRSLDKKSIIQSPASKLLMNELKQKHTLNKSSTQSPNSVSKPLSSFGSPLIDGISTPPTFESRDDSGKDLTSETWFDYIFGPSVSNLISVDLHSSPLPPEEFASPENPSDPEEFDWQGNTRQIISFAFCTASTRCTSRQIVSQTVPTITPFSSRANLLAHHPSDLQGATPSDSSTPTFVPSSPVLVPNITAPQSHPSKTRLNSFITQLRISLAWIHSILVWNQQSEEQTSEFQIPSDSDLHIAQTRLQQVFLQAKLERKQMLSIRNQRKASRQNSTTIFDPLLFGSKDPLSLNGDSFLFEDDDSDSDIPLSPIGDSVQFTFPASEISYIQNEEDYVNSVILKMVHDVLWPIYITPSRNLSSNIAQKSFFANFLNFFVAHPLLVLYSTVQGPLDLGSQERFMDGFLLRHAPSENSSVSSPKITASEIAFPFFLHLLLGKSTTLDSQPILNAEFLLENTRQALNTSVQESPFSSFPMNVVLRQPSSSAFQNLLSTLFTIANSLPSRKQLDALVLPKSTIPSDLIKPNYLSLLYSLKPDKAQQGYHILSIDLRSSLHLLFLCTHFMSLSPTFIYQMLNGTLLKIQLYQNPQNGLSQCHHSSSVSSYSNL